MPIPFIPILAAGASALGAYLQNKSQQKAAQKQMDFQERMSSTAYQRATADMKMSGINPMLAYMQGGASSPGGAQANVSDVVGPAVSSAMGAKRLSEEMRTMKLQQFNIDADTKLKYASHIRTQAETDEVMSRIRNIDASTARNVAETQVVKFGSERAGAQSKVYETRFGKSLEYIRAAREALFGGGGMFRGLPLGGN